MITLNTLLYHGNYQNILKEDSWFLRYENPIVSSKLITVNNVKDRESATEMLDKVKKESKDVDYFFVEDYEKQAVDYFSLDINKDTTRGYYYIIPYFCLLLHLKKGFVLNVSDDCTKELYFDTEFLEESVKLLTNNDKIPVTTLSWGYPKQSFGYDVGEWEQIETFRLQQKSQPEMDKFWYSVGFVDQIFLGSVDKLKKINYNLDTYDNPIYRGPWYCPNSWERRVAEYMHKNEMYRAVWKNPNHYYIHPGHKL